MGAALGAQKIGGIAIGGSQIGGMALGSRVVYRKPVVVTDSAGVLTPNVTLSGRNYVFASTITDPDGIRGITSAVLTARDGQTATIDFTRRDDNTFTHAQSRRNARWASGTMRVTYVDATSGNSHTCLLYTSPSPRDS